VIGAGPVPPPRSARVVVLPFLDTAELATALASADAFVHAGDQETFGLSVLEALACGTPAVVRAAEGLGELVDGAGFHRSGDGPVGVGVHSGTAAAFAEAITALFEHDAEALAAAARQRAEASDWQRVLPELTGHYLRLLGRESAPVAAAAGKAAQPRFAR
jgi:alpha-1,6-mannosyltransferase